METPAHVLRGRDIASWGAFRTPATAAYSYEILSPEAFPEALSAIAWARAEGLPVAVLGGGTNCLLCFDEYPGLVVRNAARGWSFSDGVLTVSSGELMSPVAAQLKSKFANPVFEAWIGLPGTFGGAVAGNAGCFGLDVASCLLDARVLDCATGEARTWTNADFRFSYRRSALRDEPCKLVVSARLNADAAKISGWKPVEASLLERKARQPADKPTCGSFFKNPPGDFAGRLVEAAGMKGFRVGGAQVAEKHANFFQNAGGATWRDVLALRDAVKGAVKGKFGVDLEEEARFIGLEA